MGQVGDDEEEVAQLGGDGGVLAVEVLFVLAECAALRHQLVCAGGIAGAASFADLLGQLVHVRPGRVALGGDVAQAAVELGGGPKLVEQLGPAPPRHRRQGGVEIGAQQPDVDHRAATLPATLVSGACRFPHAPLTNLVTARGAGRSGRTRARRHRT